MSKFSLRASLMTQQVKNLPALQETQEMQVWSLFRKIAWRRKMATHYSILAWEIPWREEPGRLQSKGSQSQTRLRHSATKRKFPLTLSSVPLPSICFRKIKVERGSSGKGIAGKTTLWYRVGGGEHDHHGWGVKSLGSWLTPGKPRDREVGWVSTLWYSRRVYPPWRCPGGQLWIFPMGGHLGSVLQENSGG